MRAWHYGPRGEAAIFEDEADVPQGWRDHPFGPDPLGHESDGRKSGSLARQRRVKG